MNNNPKKWGEEDHYLSDEEFEQLHDDLIDLLDLYIEGETNISPTSVLLAQIREIVIYHGRGVHFQDLIDSDIKRRYERYLNNTSKHLEGLINKLRYEYSSEEINVLIKYLRFQGFVIFGS